MVDIRYNEMREIINDKSNVTFHASYKIIDLYCMYVHMSVHMYAYVYELYCECVRTYVRICKFPLCMYVRIVVHIHMYICVLMNVSKYSTCVYVLYCMHLKYV